MKNNFNFFEIVKIVSQEKLYSKIFEKEGVVMAMAQNDDGIWGYGVSVNGEVWDLEEESLIKTGRFSKRENFYDEKDRITVVVDKQGKGHIK